jgi:glycolate oxidase iron-sulfur subunit
MNREAAVHISEEHPERNCAKCGACGPVCPVFRAEGRESLTARGKMHLLAVGGGQYSALFADLFSCCLLCGICEQVCPRNLPITKIVAQARSRFSRCYGPHGVKKAAAGAVLSRPALLEGLVKAGISLRLRLALLEERPAVLQPENMPENSSSLSCFVGCFARHLQPSIAAATEGLLRRCGLTAHIPVDQCCCGLAAWSAGSLEQARDLARRNIQAFAAADGPVITSCASCSAHLLTYPNLFTEDDPWHNRARTFADRVREFSTFFSQNLPPEAGSGLRVFYHDPCHLRFTKDGRTAPRSLLKQMGFTVLEPEDGPLCCGQGGLFHLAWPETSAKIFAKSCGQALAGQPDCITSTCSGCLMQYQLGLARQGQAVKAVHLAVLLSSQNGLQAMCLQ